MQTETFHVWRDIHSLCSANRMRNNIETVFSVPRLYNQSHNPTSCLFIWYNKHRTALGSHHPYYDTRKSSNWTTGASPWETQAGGPVSCLQSKAVIFINLIPPNNWCPTRRGLIDAVRQPLGTDAYWHSGFVQGSNSPAGHNRLLLSTD